MASSDRLERVQAFTVRHFERTLVLLLVASMVLIHWVVDAKIAFLSFYYLPAIIAGFVIGRRGATYAAVLIVALVAFFQTVVWADEQSLSALAVFATLAPWAGFLILTAYTVGYLADQRRERHQELHAAYVTMIELLTFHLETAERRPRGHSFKVAARATALAQAMGMTRDEVEHIRIASLLHELPPNDPRLARLFTQFPGQATGVPVVASMRTALDIVREYARYYELVGGEWPVDHMRVHPGTKILAVADTYETLTAATDARQPLTPWQALEEIERGKGATFATAVVASLRTVVGPERSEVMRLAML
jgi:hypothetical protein